MSKKFVAIAGNIGTGKTTLTGLLSERFGWQSYYEEVQNNPYLKDFYDDMTRWSFPLQIFFLTHRYKVHKRVTEEQFSSIQDRSIYEDCHIFARNLFESGRMEKRDYFSYLDLYTEMVGMLTPPDLMIYLQKSVPCLKRQISLRARDFEQNIPEDYLTCLNRYYDEWIANYSVGHVLVINSDDLDFVNRKEDYALIVDKVAKALAAPAMVKAKGDTARERITLS